MSIKESTAIPRNHVSTRNACKLCAPLGASLVFKGLKGCVPLIHGSQGCSTYIRRYMIGHYKEPVDIASTNFTESAAVFGGREVFGEAVKNVCAQYKPEIVGIATTCLAETIGDDIPQLLKEVEKECGDSIAPMVHVSTPSYRETHMQGFYEAVAAVIKRFADRSEIKTTSEKMVNLFPGFVSPADIRSLRDIVTDFGMTPIVVPDYSQTLDDGIHNDYLMMPRGGTSIAELKNTASADASLEFFTRPLKKRTSHASAAIWLEEMMGVRAYSQKLPMGVVECDRFYNSLAEISGNEIPERYQLQRGRLLDAYVDAHKYTYGKRVVVYGEEDLVASLCSFLSETGVQVILAASGGKGCQLAENIVDLDWKVQPEIMIGADFEDIAEACRELKPDMLIGHSKGYYIAKELGIPLVRVGFPVHDRFGAQRIRHIGWEGTQELFDRIVNAILEQRQEASEIGYKYF